MTGLTSRSLPYPTSLHQLPPIDEFSLAGRYLVTFRCGEWSYIADLEPHLGEFSRDIACDYRLFQQASLDAGGRGLRWPEPVAVLGVEALMRYARLAPPASIDDWDRLAAEKFARGLRTRLKTTSSALRPCEVTWIIPDDTYVFPAEWTVSIDTITGRICVRDPDGRVEEIPEPPEDTQLSGEDRYFALMDRIEPVLDRVIERAAELW